MPAPQHESSGARAIEARILLEKVCEIGRSQLHEKEWQIIEHAADSDRASMAKNLHMGDANNVRVRLPGRGKNWRNSQAWMRVEV